MSRYPRNAQRGSRCRMRAPNRSAFDA